MSIVPEYFTFEEVASSDSSFYSCEEEDTSATQYNTEYMQVLSTGSIRRPPFFQTRSPSWKLFPSRYYADPENSCIVVPPQVDYNIERKCFVRDKDDTKSISFIGCNVMEYDDFNPVTEYRILSEEECQEIYEKVDKEAVVVIEDEETLRNDNLLNQIDDMDNSSSDDAIPISRLRQYLRSGRNRMSLSPLSSSLSDESTEEAEEVEEADTSHRQQNGRRSEPLVFTFSDVSDEESESSSSTQPSSIVESGQMTDLQSHTNDSLLAENAFTSFPSKDPSKRMSLEELSDYSVKRGKAWSPSSVRSPRLSSATPRAKPNMEPMQLGAARVSGNETHFFHELDMSSVKRLSPPNTKCAFDFSLPSLFLDVKNRCIPMNAKKAMIDSCVQCSRSIMSWKEQAMALYNATKRIEEGDNLIGTLLIVINDIHAQLVRDRVDYEILKNGYNKESRYCSLKHHRIYDQCHIIKEFMKWNVAIITPSSLSLRFPLLKNCSIDVSITIIECADVHIELSSHGNAIENLQDLIAQSGIAASFKKENKIYELEDTVYSLWYYCMRINKEMSSK